VSVDGFYDGLPVHEVLRAMVGYSKFRYLINSKLILMEIYI